MRKAFLLSLTFFTLLLILNITGCRRAGYWLIIKEEPVHADAIVILMGSFPERVLQAYDSWKAGLADRILIVEESMGPFRLLEERGVNIVSHSEQAINSLTELGVPRERITLLPCDARSTLDEAGAVKAYLRINDFADTLVIITSAAHTRRAAMIFRAAFNDKNDTVVIGCIPSAYSSFNPEKWWSRKEDIQIVVTEMVKTANFMLFERGKIK